MAIFWVLLLLMAAVDINQLLFSSEGNGTVREKERGEEILQKLKEQEESLQLLYSHLKKEFTNLEGGQEAVAKPALALDTKIQQWKCKVLFLAAITLFKLWGQHLQEVTCQHSGEEETDTIFLGKAWKGVAFPDSTLCAN